MAAIWPCCLSQLSANNFIGEINIIMNDRIKRANAPFQTNIRHKIFHFSEIETPENNFVFCSNKPSTKQFLMQFFQEKWNIRKEQFFSFHHHASVMASSVICGAGFYMEPLSVISAYAKIGFGVTVSRNCSIGHHNILHDYCSVYAGSNLAGNAEICEAATVGSGCTIFCNTKIGKNSIIGGGSVVTKDIPDNVLAYGNPCKIIQKR